MQIIFSLPLDFEGKLGILSTVPPKDSSTSRAQKGTDEKENDSRLSGMW